MRKYFCLILALLILAIVPVLSQALEEKLVFLGQSKYFSVLAPTDLNIMNILNKLNYDYFLQIDSLQ